MKMLVIAAVATILSVGSAFAQGLPPGMNAPVYGTHAFPTMQYQNRTVFSELFGGSHAAKNKPVRSVQQVSKSTEG